MTVSWIPDPDEMMSPEQASQLCMSGKVIIGNVRRSRSGRFRWEFVILPGLSYVSADFHGWIESEAEAKRTVEEMWSAWLDKAGLRSMSDKTMLEHSGICGNLLGFVEVQSNG